MPGNLTFVHGADNHLDSPLHGLSRRDNNFSCLVRGATRKAFSNVADLAIEEGAAFVAIICNDLLITADNKRSAALLEILSAAAAHSQTIIFSRHQHLIGVAEQAIGAEGFRLHRIEPAAQAIAA